MKTLKIAAVAAVLAVPAIMLSIPAGAATAHNSQAGGFGASSNAGDTTVNSRHLKHTIKHAKLISPSDTDRDAGMYIVKPQQDPEYFGHGSGSDGSMPSDR